MEDKKTIKPKFDPAKSYEWNPEDEFILSGTEFQLIFNMLSNKLKDEKFQQHVLEYESYKVMQNLLVKGVEEGLVKEIEDKED